jgi:hypothetical protein
VELLVPETPSGELLLKEALVVDAVGRYLVPALGEGLPEGAGRYQTVPWCSAFFGDRLKTKEAFRHVRCCVAAAVPHARPCPCGR